jgi:hypothetical protein
MKQTKMQLIRLIGVEVSQKGGTSLYTLAKDSSKWVDAIAEINSIFDELAKPELKSFKKIRKLLKYINDRCNATTKPYIVINEEENKVITCGHYNIPQLRKNH